MTDERLKAPTKPAEGGIDYSGRPFGYVAPDRETAMICEQDPVIRDKIIGDVKKLEIGRASCRERV